MHMAKTGLIRLPYYPQLTALFDGRHGPESLVLSALLYWNTRDKISRFQKTQHLYQLALHLRLSPEEVGQSITCLENMGIAYYVRERQLKKKDPAKLRQGLDLPDEYKEREFLRLDLKKLSMLLQRQGQTTLSPLLLRHAAEDNFEIYDVINKERLPATQYLEGKISGPAFDAAALRCARLACAITAADEDFAQRAVAPGWRMLLQPPAQPQDIASRWTRPGERAIDLEFADGTIFLPDNDCFGALTHRIAHRGNSREARVLAAAFLLAAAWGEPELHFCSEIDLGEIKEAIALLYHSCGMKARLSPEFCSARLLDSIQGKALLDELNSFANTL